MDLHFHRITETDYRATLATHDGEKWVRGVYTVRSTPELTRADPFHRWQAETPEGFIIAEGYALTQAMSECQRDVPNWVQHVNGDITAVQTDPMLVQEVA